MNNLPPIEYEYPGIEVRELFGSFGMLVFQMELHAQDPHFGWLETQPGGLDHA